MIGGQKKSREKKSKKIKKFINKYMKDNIIMKRIKNKQQLFKLIIKQQP